MFGAGGKFFGGKRPTGGGGGGGVASVTADNGLSLDPGSTLTNPIVVLGDDGDLSAQLLSNRFIDLGGNFLQFTDNSGADDKVTISDDGVLADHGGSFKVFVNDDISQVFGATGNRNGFMRIVVNNGEAGINSGAGSLFINDLGHGLQNYVAGSVTDNSFIADSVLIRDTGSTKMLFHQNENQFFFDYTTAFDAPEVSMKGFGSGNWIVQGSGDFAAQVDQGSVLQVIDSFNIRNRVDDGSFTDIIPNQLTMQSGADVNLESVLTPAELFLSGDIDNAVYADDHFSITNFSTLNEVICNDSAIEFFNTADLTANSVLTLAALNIQDSGGVHQGGYSFIEMQLQDNSTGSTLGATAESLNIADGLGDTSALGSGALEFVDISGATAEYAALDIQLFDGVSAVVTVTPSSVTVEDTGTNDVSFFGADGFTASDSSNSSNSILTKTNLQVGNPVSGSNIAVADFYGDFTTDDPLNPGTQGAAIKFGQIVNGVVALDATRYIAASWNGVNVKVLIAA